MYRRLIFASSLALIFLGYGCSSKKTENTENDKLKIVVSIPPQMYLVKSIGGGYVDVESVMTSDANPESFEPTVLSMRTITDADAYIPIGLLDFEKSLVSKLKQNSPDLDIINNSEGLMLLYDTHSECDHHDHQDHDSHQHYGKDADPHVWCSVRNMRTMAQSVADILIRKDYEHAEYYTLKRDSLLNRIDSIDNALTAIINNSGASSFMVWHPSLSYFAKDYGLEQIVVGSHSKELSIKQLQSRINQASESGAKIFFLQQEFDSNQAEVLNNHIEAEISRLNTMNEDWENEMKKIADGFSRQ